MSRFNPKSQAEKTLNFEGGESFKVSPEMKLYTIVCTSLLTPQFYVPSTNDQLNKIKSLINKVDPIFVAKLAIYARENMNLRTIPLVLTVELAKKHNSTSLVRKLTNRVIKRADEITELLAYYVKSNPSNKEEIGGQYKCLRKLSSQIKKGVADSFHRFNEYQFAKYNRDSEIKLRDALFISHPKPAFPEEEELFKKIASNTLMTPYTWETQLSEAGKTGRSKKEVWEELIDSGKLGFMAMLRNLRNFQKEEISPKHIVKVCNRLTNVDEVRNSKQLPFRFLSAYRSLVGLDGRIPTSESFNMAYSPFLNALEKAVKISTENIPMFKDEKIFIASDVSGSMIKEVSPKSTIMNYDIGLLLSFLVKNVCKDATIGVFGSEWATLDSLYEIKEDKPLANVANSYKIEGKVGYATNGYKALDYAMDKEFDRLFFFTDCVLYDSGMYRNNSNSFDKRWSRYHQLHPNAKLYVFNLAPYGLSPIDIRQKNRYLISGWNDSIFQVINSLEKGSDALKAIYGVEI